MRSLTVDSGGGTATAADAKAACGAIIGYVDLGFGNSAAPCCGQNGGNIKQSAGDFPCLS
jgi:hypothetical protein